MKIEKLKGEWIFTIVKSLESRLEYIQEDAPTTEEENSCEEALKFFKCLSFEIQQEESK